MTNAPLPVLLLAAGGSRRFGADKLLAPIAGQPLLAWTVELVLDAVPADEVLVVVGPEDAARQALLEVAGVASRTAPDAARGMAWSLDAGLQACPAAAPGAIVLLADDPLAARALPQVRAAALRQPRRMVAMRRDPFLPHPVYLPRTTWPAPPCVDCDHGLRDLLGSGTTWLDDPGVHPVDVDTPDDVESLVAALRRAGG